MEIIPLGVGSAFAKTLDNTNYLIRPGRGEPFLIDCGVTATRALVHLGVPPSTIQDIVVSHLHADHIGGLEEMGFSGAFLWGRKVRLHLPEQLLENLWEHSLSGGMGQRLRTCEGTYEETTLETYFQASAIGAEPPLTLGSVTVTPFRTPHIPGRASFGYALKDDETGGTAMLTCDSQLSRRNLEQYGREADIIFHDCQLDGGDEGIHTSLASLLKVPEEYRAKIVLIHYGDEWPGYVGQTLGMEFARQRHPYKV